MCQAHNDLIKVIIDQEEDLISSHRTHIDQVVEIIKQDMSLLQVVDQPNSDITHYVQSLDRVLIKKVEMIGKLREQLVGFYRNLKREEQLQALYASRQDQQDDFDDMEMGSIDEAQDNVAMMGQEVE